MARRPPLQEVFSIKAWLERNKIIFETLVAASLTVMGVLVSIAAVFVSVNQNKLISQQYELERYGTEPVFTVEYKKDKNGTPLYVAKNIGAEIHDVSFISIAFSKCFYYSPEKFGDFEVLLNYFLELPLGNEFDEQAQSFSLDTQTWEEKAILAMNDIERLENIFSYYCCIHIGLMYKNYRNEYCQSAIEIRPSLTDADSDFTYSFFVDSETSSLASEEFEFIVTIQENPFEEIQEELAAYLDNNN